MDVASQLQRLIAQAESAKNRNEVRRMWFEEIDPLIDDIPGMSSNELRRLSNLIYKHLNDEQDIKHSFNVAEQIEVIKKNSDVGKDTSTRRRWSMP